MIRSAIAAAGGNEMAQAGLLSNFDYESGGLNPGAQNPLGAIGQAQWVGSRKVRLGQIAATMGLPMTDARPEAALIQEELSGPYAGVLARMNAAGSYRESAEIGLRGYEGINESNSLQAGAPWPRMLATHLAAADRYGAATPGAAGVTGATLPVMSPQAIFGTSAPPPGAGTTGFDWSGRENAKDLARVHAELAAAAAAPDFASAAAQDTQHHVEVRFVDAPAGMRSGLTRADGPATFGLQVQHAASTL